MSKVLIDRELLERVKTLCEEWFVRGQQPHMSATDYKVWHAIGFASKAFDSLRTALAAPSGTPAMPVKAYYHEVPNEYGGLNKSVGLEVRKAFTDAPLVLESDALARIACLEGEIAKRDARILELESQYQRDVYGLNNEGDPIGGDPAGGYANDNARLRAELAAIKAQEPVAEVKHGPLDSSGWPEFVRVKTIGDFDLENLPNGMKLYAAPVPEAKAQGVVMPERLKPSRYGLHDAAVDAWNSCLDEVARLNAAPVQQVSVPDVSAMARILADRNADACNVNREDNWMIYGQDYIDDVTAMLYAAPAAPAADACKACKGTGRRPIGGRGRIFGLTNHCFECQPLTAEEVYGTGDSHDQ